MSRVQVLVSKETRKKLEEMMLKSKRTIGKEIEYILEQLKINENKEYEI